MAAKILSKRDKPKFSHDGYIYVLDKCSKSDPMVLFWRCELKNICKGRIHTKNNEVLKKVNEHCHSASAVEVKVACIKTSLKRKTQETLEVPSTISGSIQNSSQAAQGSVLNSQNLKKIVRRKRKPVPPNPENSRELVITEGCKLRFVTKNGQSENFLADDSREEDERLSIFGRQNRLVFFCVSWKCGMRMGHLRWLRCMARRHGGVSPTCPSLDWRQNSSVPKEFGAM